MCSKMREKVSIPAHTHTHIYILCIYIYIEIEFVKNSRDGLEYGIREQI
jgi:hypothetical protein